MKFFKRDGKIVVRWDDSVPFGGDPADYDECGDLYWECSILWHILNGFDTKECDKVVGGKDLKENIEKLKESLKFVNGILDFGNVPISNEKMNELRNMHIDHDGGFMMKFKEDE